MKPISFLKLTSVLLLVTIQYKLNAQVTIITPSVTIPTCSYPTGYGTLPDIIIDELNPLNKTAFATGLNQTLILKPANGSELEPGIGSVLYTASRDIVSASVLVSANYVTVTYSVQAATKVDKLIIRGLKFRAGSMGNFQLLRNGGTGTISGDVDGTLHGSVISSPMSSVYKIGGAPSDFSTITQGLTAIRNTGLNGHTVFELKPDYNSASEIYPINFSGLNCLHANATLTIRPEAGAAALSISSASTVTIALNGASYVTFDGRPGGTGSANELTISNTSTTGNVFQFINGAMHNTIQYCNVNGVNTTTKGNIVFATSATNSGNSYNTIQYCDLGAGATTPNNIITSNGTTGKDNIENTISNNKIHDFFSPSVDCNGIMLVNNTHSWEIAGNSFYETTSRNFTSSVPGWCAVQIRNKVSGNNFRILNNHIGGSAPGCGGSAMTITGTGKMHLIEITGGPGTANSLQGNIISNINFTTNNSNFHSLIQHNSGSLDIGNQTGNTFGSLTSTGNIVINYTGGSISAPGRVSLIHLGASTGSASTVNFSNNQMGGIKLSGSGYARLRLMEIKGTSYEYIISSNSFGGIVTNSIENNLNSSFVAVLFRCAGPEYVFENNIIRNLTSNPAVSTEAALGGIQLMPLSNNPVKFKVQDNSVYNLRTNAKVIGDVNCFGIHSTITTPLGLSISGNIIHTLVGTTSGFSGEIQGLYLSAPSSGDNIVSNNFIHSLSANNGNTFQVTGIVHGGGAATYSNNVIRLGVDVSGNNQPANNIYTGIKETGGSSVLLFNTMYIAGTNSTGNNFSAAFRSTGNGNRTILNNAFINARNNNNASNYSVYISSLNGLISDNNNLFTPGTNGKTGFAVSTVYNSLNTYQAGTAKETSSVSGDPYFASPHSAAAINNLNITGSSASNNTGTTVFPANTILTDINGVPRSVTNADIGAFEKAGISGIWTGAVSSNWNDLYNWQDSIIPDSNTDVVISSAPNMPLLANTQGFSRNLSIQLPVSSLTVSGTGVLKVAGSIANSGSLSLNNGSLELNGSSSQNISGSLFNGRSIKKLIINNNVNVSASFGDTLYILEELSFGDKNDNVLTTGDNLVLYSRGSGTAGIADMTNGGMNYGNKISGNVIAERFIPNHSKKWQFLASPVTGQTIKQAWQEGSATPLSNPNSGYGTILTSHLPAAISLGFDIYTPSASSVLSYNSSNDTWQGISGTSLPVSDKKGYFIFVRGDRSVSAYNQPATETVMRSTGSVYQPVNPPSDVTVSAGKLEAVANPYASAIDFSKINRTGGVADMYYVWDPALYGTSGYGAWQTISSNYPAPGYTVTPGGGNYASGAMPIQSGQSFLISAPFSSGSISFNESVKVSGSKLVTRESAEMPYSVMVSLIKPAENENLLIDACRTLFHEGFSDEVDVYDATKVNVSGESISFLSASKRLSVDKRLPIYSTDTLFLITDNLKKQEYLLKISVEEMELHGRYILVKDRFLNTETLVSSTGETFLRFNVTNDQRSAFPDRFLLIFKQAAVVPVMFTSTYARREENRGVDIKWSVDHEINLLTYLVETSSDGINFTTTGKVFPSNNNGGKSNYFLNVKNGKGTFFRINALNLSGTSIYSRVMTISEVEKNEKISFYPNPVVSKKLNVSINNKAEGTFLFRAKTFAGQVVFEKNILMNGGGGITVIDLPQTMNGIYILTIEGSEGKFSKIIYVN